MVPDLQMSLDRSSPVPLYFQIAQQLEQAIEDGRLAPGDHIGSELDMADRLGLSRPTMRQAIRILVDRGLVVRKRGVGTQVVQHSRIRRPVRLTSLYDDLAAAHQKPRTKVLALTTGKATDEVAHHLGLRPGTEVWSVERLRFAGDEPLALMHNHLPVDSIALSQDALERRGLYEILRASGVHMRVASQSVGARKADAREARLLSENRGAPLLTMTRIAYDDHGRAVEHADHVYRPSLYSFEFTLVDR